MAKQCQVVIRIRTWRWNLDVVQLWFWTYVLRRRREYVLNLGPHRRLKNGQLLFTPRLIIRRAAP